jgi:hypothetical protein
MKATRSATSDQRKRPLTGNRLKSNFLSGICVFVNLSKGSSIISNKQINDLTNKQY